MKMYKKYIEQNHPETERVVDGVLESIQCHTWYLDETLVPLALLNQDISAEDRKAMAKRLPIFSSSARNISLYRKSGFTFRA